MKKKALPFTDLDNPVGAINPKASRRGSLFAPMIEASGGDLRLMLSMPWPAPGVAEAEGSPAADA